MQPFRRPIAHTLAAALLSGILVTHPAIADIIKLRDGLEHRGAIANRDQVRAAPGAFEVIAILVEPVDGGEAKLIRVARVDIDYLVLQDADEQQVVDFQTLRSALGATWSQDTEATEKKTPNTKAVGGVLMVTGGAVALFGALTKLGDEELRISGDTAEWERTYNDLNYFLMAIGVLTFAVGLGLVARDSGPTSGLSGAISDGVPYMAYSGTF